MIDEFTKHNSDKPPELAPAVLVEIEDWNMSFMAGGVKMHPLDEGAKRHPSIRKLRVDQITQWFMLKYRVLRNSDGHPYVSAEGLEPWARWVATDYDGAVFQFDARPDLPDEFGGAVWWTTGCDIAFATMDFAHPGDWRDSLCEVWREDHE